MKTDFLIKLSGLVFFTVAMMSCGNNVVIENNNLQLVFDKSMRTKVNSLNASSEALTKKFQYSEYLQLTNEKTEAFSVSSVNVNELNNGIGVGKEYLIRGRANADNYNLEKLVSVKIYEDFPDFAIYDVSYVNLGKRDLNVLAWVNNNYEIVPQLTDTALWSFHGSSSAERADWVRPISKGFYQENFMGMNQSDYGGGIPVVDVWRKDAGVAVGHVEMVPKEVSLPVSYDKYAEVVDISIKYEFDGALELSPNDTLRTNTTFVSVHKGDYYSTLSRYSKLMQAKGIKFVEPEESAFESVWCGWGYERKFTAEEIIQTLPKVKDLGIQWAVIDDGFQIAEGDWRVDKKRFPGGSKDMKKMVNAIHDHGMKAKLWWAPLAVDPGTEILENDPQPVLTNKEIILVNKDGAPQFITWWDSYYMSPAAEITTKHTKETIAMFMDEWGFDGLKMDGQHMNAVPGEYNWNRALEYPEKTIELLPEFFKMIYEEARAIKPNAVLENCPCGTCMSFYNMPYTNQTVSSDPLSSWQIRHKGKTYKAIMPQMAYYGDHVELSDDGSDFASSFGVGAVLGTKFTWPSDNPHADASYLLTPEKEIKWKKWFDLYHNKMLSKEEYLGGLYDIGFDKPETHVIKKGSEMYYAFYSKHWSGELEFRGLEEGVEYSVYDYVNDKNLGVISSTQPLLNTPFKNHLLVVLRPKK